MATVSANKLELLQIADAVAREKAIDRKIVLGAMEDAIAKAARSRYGSETDVHAEIDPKSGELHLSRHMQVVDAVENPASQITLDDARRHHPAAQVGDTISDKLPPLEYGRIAAQSAKQVIVQKVREAERDRQFDEFKDRVGTIVNGLVKRGERKEPIAPGIPPFWAAYAQRSQLFANDGNGHFRDISGANPAFCGRAIVGRSLVYGDIDNDGAVDLLVTSTGGPAQLFRNIAPRRGHWLSIRAIEPALGGRDAYGAEISVQAGGRRWQQWSHPASSYLCSHDPRAHFGLGPVAEIDSIEVRWPDGVLESFAGGAPDRILVLAKGAGRAAPSSSDALTTPGKR